MKKSWYEIVRCPSERFGWRFVEERSGKRRVLALGAQDYRSKKKVRQTISHLRLMQIGYKPDVIDATEQPERLRIYVADLCVDPTVTPLIVGEDGRRQGRSLAVRARG